MQRILTTILFVTLTVGCVSAQSGEYAEPVNKTGFFKRIFKGGDRNKNDRAVTKVYVPRVAVERWFNEDMIPAINFIHKFDEIVPDSLRTIELFMTNSINGWYIEGRTMYDLNGGARVYKNSNYSYSDYRRMDSVAAARGVEIVPVFDLGSRNEIFFDITGHNMLSVEGFRFVRMLLWEFIENARPAKIAFIIPEGKYKNNIYDLMKRYPDTEFYFINR
ncbi:MAG: hypothetical protein LIO79_10860 [Rikenellaceae bacterium]|nr:hypothetical protein [Rikenellaceae bacterium]